MLSDRTLPFHIAAAIGSLLLAAPSAPTEEQPTLSSLLSVGSRVRVQAPARGPGLIQGTVLEVDDTGMLLSAAGLGHVRVEQQSISRLEVSTGRGSSSKKGAVIGGAIGAVIGAVAGGTNVPEGPCIDAPATTCPASPGGAGNAFAGAAVGGALGAGWGALLGHLKKHDLWSPVPLTDLRVSFVAIRGRAVSLSMSLRW